MPSSVKQWIESLRTAAGMPMFKPPFLVRFAALYIFALPITLLAQAAVEYALKSTGSAATVNSNATIAGCRMDSALLTCLSHVYPQTTILIVVAVCLLIVRWLAGHIGYRAH